MLTQRKYLEKKKDVIAVTTSLIWLVRQSIDLKRATICFVLWQGVA